MSKGDIERRDFLRVVGASATLLPLAACGSHQDPYALEKPPVPGAEAWRKGEERFIATSCAQCAAGCGTLVRVVEGRAIKIDGHPGSPVNRGGIGPRGLAGPQVLYDPDRLRQPLRREGPRGTGKLVPVAWEDAIAMLAARLRDLRERGEPERVAVACGRQRGLMLELWRRFARAYGTPNFFDGNHDANGVVATAVDLMQGVREIPACDWGKVRYVLSLGSGILDSSCQLVAFARAQPALRRGPGGGRAKIVHVGPWRSRSAMNADEWIRARPGTYAAIALGIAHLLVKSGRYDRDFVANQSIGFERWHDEQGIVHPGLLEVLEEYVPDKVTSITGVDAKSLEKTAREIWEQRPSFAIGTSEDLLFPNGVSTAMAIHALNALLGAIDRPGGLFVQRDAPLEEWPEPELDDFAVSGLARPRIDGVGTSRLQVLGAVPDAVPEAIERSSAQLLDTLLLYYANPLFSRPQPESWRRALAKVPFVVSFSPFLDETVADAADLVLPDSSYLERWEDAAPAPSVGYPVFGIRQPVVATLYDTRATGDVVLQIARGIGGAVEAAFPFQDFKSAMLKRIVGLHQSKRGSIVEDSGSEFLKKLWAQGCWSDPAPDPEPSQGVFRTPSGKFEFFSQRMRSELAMLNDGLPVDALCLPRHEPMTPSPDPVRFPLLLVPFRPNTDAEGSGANLPWLRKLTPVPGRTAGRMEAQIHPETAQAFGVHDGDLVSVESSVGNIQLSAHVHDGVVPGILVAPKGLGHSEFGRFAKGRGANLMRLIASGGVPSASGASQPVTWVSIRRVGP